MKSLRILLAGQVYTDGNGQGSFTVRIAEHLVQSGHEVRMLVPSERLGSNTVIINGVQVEKVPAIHMAIIHPAIYLTPYPAPRVREVLKEFKPDVIHIQDHYFLSSAVVREARKLNIPIIGTNHFLPDNLLPFFINHATLRNLASRPLWKMMLDVFNHLDAVTTPSHAAVNILKQQDIHPPVYAVSNGVERDRFFPDPQIDSASIRRGYNLRADQPLFLYVGRLDGEKSVDLIVNAISKIQRKDFQFAIVGHGKERQALTDQIHRLGLEGRVHILGYIPSKELPPLYLAADVFVMPSPAELQSIATLEALACGKPVLAANARALPELVTHEVNGYLFEPGNIADAAHWMNEFIAHPERWTAMGKESLKQAQRHGIDKTVQAYEQVYQQAMELKQKNAEVEKPASVHSSIFDVFRSGKVFKR